MRSFRSLLKMIHVLTSLPPATLENKDLRIQVDWLIFDDLAVLLKTESVEVEVMPGSDSELKGMLHKLGSSGWDIAVGKELDGDQIAGASNELWERMSLEECQRSVGRLNDMLETVNKCR